ncbi:hypothetical protein EIP91_011578, partial [Steccherinum ochraceum]
MNGLLSGAGLDAGMLSQLGAMLNSGECRSIEELLAGDEPLKGMESMMLRTFFTS